MRTLEGECKEGVLHIEASTREFQTIAGMEVRTSTLPVKKRTGVDPLAWNSSQVIAQQQGNSCSVIDEELLFTASISTARYWTQSACTLLYRMHDFGNWKCWRRRLTTRNLKLSGQQQEPTLAVNKCEPAGFSFPRQRSRPLLPAVHYLNRPTSRHYVELRSSSLGRYCPFGWNSNVAQGFSGRLMRFLSLSNTTHSNFEYNTCLLWPRLVLFLFTDRRHNSITTRTFWLLRVAKNWQLLIGHGCRKSKKHLASGDCSVFPHELIHGVPLKTIVLAVKNPTKWTNKTKINWGTINTFYAG